MDIYVYPHEFDDFAVGQVIEHEQRRVLTEADNLLFSRMSGHEHPALFPYGSAAAGPVPVNPFLVLAIVGGISVRATSKGAIANLGWKYVRFPERAFVGDELRAITEIRGKRQSKSNPARGIVNIGTYGLTQDGRVVSETDRSFMVRVG